MRIPHQIGQEGNGTEPAPFWRTSYRRPQKGMFCQDNDDGAFRVRTREQTNLKRSDAGRVPGGFPKPGSLERAVR